MERFQSEKAAQSTPALVKINPRGGVHSCTNGTEARGTRPTDPSVDLGVTVATFLLYRAFLDPSDPSHPFEPPDSSPLNHQGCKTTSRVSVFSAIRRGREGDNRACRGCGGIDRPLPGIWSTSPDLRSSRRYFLPPSRPDLHGAWPLPTLFQPRRG